MNNKSFTLIELLVVIVIIGILAGVIIVSTSSSISKANIAKVKVFENNIQNELGANMVSRWKLDEIVGTTTTPDAWGGSTGIIASTPVLKSEAECITGNCMSFDGTDDYIDCGNDSNLNIINALTVNLWVKSTKNNASLFQGIVGKANLSGYEYGWIISKMVDNKFYFQVKHNYCVATKKDISTHSNEIYTDSNWHHIVGVLESNGSHFMYIDGVKQTAFGSPTSWTPAAASIKLVIGTAYGDLPTNTTHLERFRGLIDDVRIYNTALTATQIKQEYIAGLNSLLANGNISKEEYDQRLENLALGK